MPFVSDKTKAAHTSHRQKPICPHVQSHAASQTPHVAAAGVKSGTVALVD